MLLNVNMRGVYRAISCIKGLRNMGLNFYFLIQVSMNTRLLVAIQGLLSC